MQLDTMTCVDFVYNYHYEQRQFDYVSNKKKRNLTKSFNLSLVNQKQQQHKLIQQKVSKKLL